MSEGLSSEDNKVATEFYSLHKRHAEDVDDAKDHLRRAKERVAQSKEPYNPQAEWQDSPDQRMVKDMARGVNRAKHDYANNLMHSEMHFHEHEEQYKSQAVNEAKEAAKEIDYPPYTSEPKS